MLGRPRGIGAAGARTAIDAMRPYGIDTTVLVANQIEALLEIGEWDRADRAERGRPPRDHRQLRTHAADHPRDLETGRGDFAHARAHLDAARAPLRLDRDLAMLRRLRAPSSPSGSGAGSTRRRPCATGWRGRGPARPPRSACGSAPRACGHRRSWPRSPAHAATPTASATGSVGRGSCIATRAAPPPRPSAVTPNATGWLALADAEYERARGAARPDLGRDAAGTWERLERPPLAAYCRWRQAEALVAVGASRAEASVPLRQAHAVAARIGAAPLARELELLAGRARLDLTTPECRNRRTATSSALPRGKPRC